MSKLRSLLIIVWLAATLPFAYGGCVLVFTSGDVDDVPDREQSDDDESSFRFVGQTNEAVIDPATAVELARGALAGGVTEAQPEVSVNLRSVNQASTGNLRSLRLPLTLGRVLRRIELKPSRLDLFRQTVSPRCGTLGGSCGGWIDYSVQSDQTTGEFDGSLSFHDYCEPGLMLSGEVRVDGSFDRGSGDATTANFQFESLTDDPMTLDGEIFLDFTNQPTLATIECYAEDGVSGKVYWINAYSLNLLELPGRTEIEVFGRFYHPDYGYVTASTNIPFVLDDGDAGPAAGELVIDGLNGTQARLTALGQRTYGVQADTDGDGGLDWSSE